MKGENDLTLYKFKDEDIFLIHGIIGCPAICGCLEIAIALGVSKIMFCGGGGVLDSSLQVGKLLVVEVVIRDERTSYHYVPPTRVIFTNENVTNKIYSYLDRKAVPYIKGIVWTTDAIYTHYALVEICKNIIKNYKSRLKGDFYITGYSVI